MNAEKVYGIIDLIGENKFLQFARKSLGLSQNEIEDAEHRNPRNLTEQKYNMVLTWHAKTGYSGTSERLQELFQEFHLKMNTTNPNTSHPSSNHPDGDQNTASLCPGECTTASSPHPTQMNNAGNDGLNQAQSKSTTTNEDTNALPTNEEGGKHILPSSDDTTGGPDVEPTTFDEDEPDGDSDQSDGSVSPASPGSLENALNSQQRVEAQNKATYEEETTSQLHGATPEDPSDIVDMMHSMKNLNVKLAGSDYFQLCQSVPVSIEVDHCPTEMPMSLKKNNQDYYPILDRSYKGYIIIFNNTFKNVKGQKERRGSLVDVKNLKSLWKEIQGCKVLEKPNLKARTLKEEMGKFVTSKKRKDCGFVAFFIMSHGNCDYYTLDGQYKKGEGFILGNDGEKVMISEILDMLGNDYPGTTLQDIPKLIFFQACRGNELDHGTPRSSLHHTVETDRTETHQIATDGNMTRMSDVLQGYATQEGYKAIRHSGRGSWYINAIVNVFRQYAKQDHVLDLLTKVNDAVFKMSDNLENGEPCKEMCEKRSTLRRKLYFFPGQENEEY